MGILDSDSDSDEDGDDDELAARVLLALGAPPS
jgi:hypothetical protein